MVWMPATQTNILRITSITKRGPSLFFEKKKIISIYIYIFVLIFAFLYFWSPLAFI